MTGKSDGVRGHVRDTDGAELTAPVLSEQACLQQRLNLAGRGIRLRGGTRSRMLPDAPAERGEGDHPMAPPGEQRPAA